MVDRGIIIERDCVGIVIDGFVVSIDEKINLEIVEMLAGSGAPQG